MNNEVLSSGTEFIKIYQQNVNVSKSSENAEINELRQKLKEHEETIEQQIGVIEQQKKKLIEIKALSMQAQNITESGIGKINEQPKTYLLMKEPTKNNDHNEVSKMVAQDQEDKHSQKPPTNNFCPVVQQLFDRTIVVNDNSRCNNYVQNNSHQQYKPRTFYNKEEGIKIFQTKASNEPKPKGKVNANTAEEFNNQNNLSTTKKKKNKKLKKQKKDGNNVIIDEENDRNNESELVIKPDQKIDEHQHVQSIDEIMQERDLNVLIKIAKDSNSKLQDVAIFQARELLASEKKKSDEYIEKGFLPVLIECLKSQSVKTQIEAVRVLTFFAAGTSTETKLIVDLNIISPLIALLGSSDCDVIKYSLRCLSYIIYEESEFRDKCFELGFLPAFFKVANDDLSTDVTRTIFNMCRFKSAPISTQIFHKILPILDKCFESDDVDVLNSAFSVVFVLCWLKEDYHPLIIQHRFIDKMIAFLDNSNLKIVQASLNAIERITAQSTEETKIVVDADIIPVMINLLESSEKDIKNVALGVLGNIAEDKGVYRDKCIEYGLVPKMLKLITEETTIDQLRYNIDLVSSLCQSNSYPLSTNIVKELVPIFKKYIHHEDEIVVRKITLILWQIAVKKDSEKNQILIDNDIFKEIIPLLNHSNETIQHHTSRVVLNMVFGTPEQVQHVINCGVMDYMEALLNHKTKEITDGMLFFLRKIIWSPNKHLQALIDANLIPSIIQLLKHDSVLIQKNAVWVISNFSVIARPGFQMEYLLKHEFLATFCKFLDSAEVFNVKLVLKGINAILRKCNAQQKPEIKQTFMNCGAVEKIKELEANYIDQEIGSLVKEIMRNHFSLSCGAPSRPTTQRNINNFMPSYFSK